MAHLNELLYFHLFINFIDGLTENIAFQDQKGSAIQRANSCLLWRKRARLNVAVANVRLEKEKTTKNFLP